MPRNIEEMVSSLKLPASSRCVKYLMFSFNLLFVITGIISLSIGVTIHAVYRNYQHFLDNKFLSVPNLLIAIGALIFIIAFFGCCGAVRENYCMIVTFAALMVIVFILEFSGGIAGYVLRDNAKELIGTKMMATMPQYRNNSEIEKVWIELQDTFQCCGTNKPEDWIKALNVTDNSLPQSCCDVPSRAAVGALPKCELSANSTILHKKGCLDTFIISVNEHAVQLGGVGLGIAFVQAIGVWFAIYLARSIKSTYETV